LTYTFISILSILVRRQTADRHRERPRAATDTLSAFKDRFIYLAANEKEKHRNAPTLQLMSASCKPHYLGKHNQRNITICPMRYGCLINITRKTHFVHISDTLADNSRNFTVGS